MKIEMEKKKKKAVASRVQMVMEKKKMLMMVAPAQEHMPFRLLFQHFSAPFSGPFLTSRSRLQL